MNDSLLTLRSVRTVVAVLVTLALALAGGCTTAPAAWDASRYATLAAVIVGGERLARADELSQVRVWRGGALVATQPNMALQRGDLVLTGPDAYTVLHYEKVEVLMRPSSQGRVGSLTEVVGEVFARIRGIFAVETTFVRAGANGTAYLVRGAADGSATVTVFDGTVTLSSRVGAWPAQSLPTGATAFCPPRGGVPQTHAASAQELEQTRAWVERIEKVMAPRTNYGAVIGVAAIAVLIGVILGSRGGSSSSGTGTSSTGGNPQGTVIKARPNP